MATPGLTAISDEDEARRVLLDDALRVVPLVRATPGTVIDVGSGGGSPGIPVAVSLPDRHVTLLDAQRRKCAFLERFASELPNVEVVWGRAEAQPPDSFDVALAKALAQPPVAVELTLPLVRPGGIAVLWVGKSADPTAVARAAAMLSGVVEESPRGLLVLRKTHSTPAGFPRKPGMAKKRPLV